MSESETQAQKRIVPTGDGNWFRCGLILRSVEEHGHDAIAAEGTVEVVPHPEDETDESAYIDFESTYRVIIWDKALPEHLEEQNETKPDAVSEWFKQMQKVWAVESVVTNVYDGEISIAVNSNTTVKDFNSLEERSV